jgi:transcriptional regulator with XRE-family HTH domain
MAQKGENSSLEMPFGQVLRSIRLARGLTLEFIASKTGRNQSYLSAIERGKMPSSEFLSDIANYYGCPWWHRTRNEMWLHSVAWICGNDTITNASRNHATMTQLHFVRARKIVFLVAEASKLSTEIIPLVQRLGEQLQLPGVAHLPLGQSIPIWAWISASLEDDVLDRCHEEAVVDQAQCIITYVANTFRTNTLDIDRVALGTAVHKLREMKGWTPENLAQVTNRIWNQGHPRDPIVDTAYILELEQGTAPINMSILGALAQALEVAPSGLLVEAPTNQRITERDITDMLRAYGLDDEAIASIQGLIAFWRNRDKRHL